MANSTFKIEARVTYDGKKDVESILTGHTMNFRLPGIMPEMEFLPFGSLVVDAPIPYGETGAAVFWIVVTDRERNFLTPEAEFLLYSGGEVVGRGQIKALEENPT